MMTPKQIAEQGTFLISEVGSKVHGTNLEGADDLDLMGVTFQPPDYLLGLQHFEQYIFRTAEERLMLGSWDRTGSSRQSPKSGPGDIDLVIYSVQKFFKLALSGNPSILVLFFSKNIHHPINPTTTGDTLPSHKIEDQLDLEWLASVASSFLRLAPDLASKQAGVKFLGYLRAQKERMLGQRGQMRVTRTDLIEQYGFDSKYAMQACRLGLQGIEYMQQGKLTLPMPAPVSDSLKAVRMGDLTFSEVIDWIDSLEEELKDAIDSSPLPKRPNHGKVDEWLIEAQLEFFEWHQNKKGIINLDSLLQPSLAKP